MRFAITMLSALALSITAAAQDAHEPIALNPQFNARMTHSQALELENLSLKLNNTYMMISQQAKVEYEKKTGAIAANRTALISAILKENKTLAWDDDRGTFFSQTPSAETPPGAGHPPLSRNQEPAAKPIPAQGPPPVIVEKNAKPLPPTIQPPAPPAQVAAPMDEPKK